MPRLAFGAVEVEEVDDEDDVVVDGIDKEGTVMEVEVADTKPAADGASRACFRASDSLSRVLVTLACSSRIL